MEPAELDVFEYIALGEFRHQIRRYLRLSEDRARSAGLEPQQHHTLLAIKALGREQSPTVSAIAQALVIRHHSAVGLIDRLEERGLAERHRSGADRRQVLVRLTPAGEEVLRGLAGAHRDELRISGKELVHALGSLLEKAEHRSAGQ